MGVRTAAAAAAASSWSLLILPLVLLAQAPVPVPAFTLKAAVAYPIRVAFQGEPGAYSEKALRELLGPHVLAVGKPSFEDTFKVCPWTGTAGAGTGRHVVLSRRSTYD
jgi:hypothetical protein